MSRPDVSAVLGISISSMDVNSGDMTAVMTNALQNVLFTCNHHGLILGTSVLPAQEL